MKRLLIIFCVVFISSLMFAGTFPVSAAGETDYVNTTYTMQQAWGKIKTQGRTGLVGTGMSMDWTGSGVEFNADCRGNILFNLTVQSVYQCAYLTLYVDGICMNRFEAKTSSDKREVVKLEVSTNLTEGNHNICLYNDTECSRALVSLESIQMYGHLTEPPKNKDLLIEYVGDSYLTGYGNLVETQTTGDILSNTPSISDGMQSLGVLTAKELNADYSVLAVSGYGLVCGTDGLDANMPKFYDYVSWMRSHTKNSSDLWNFPRKPDIIVVELGDNDRYSADECGVTNSDFQEEAKKFVEHLRSQSHDAKIVWTLFGYEDEIKETFEELGGESTGLFTTTVHMDSGGGKGHPTTAELYDSADELSAYLKGIVLPTITTSVSETDMTIASETTETENTTDTPSAITKPENNTQTGGTSHKMIPWMILIAVTVVLVCALVFFKRKKDSAIRNVKQQGK